MKSYDWKVCIRSYKKEKVLKSLTLATLKRGGIPNNRILIFVADEQEREKYDQELKGEYEIIVGRKGLLEIDNFMTDYFPENTPLVFMDDDLKKIEFIENRGDVKSSHEIENLSDFFDYGFYLCEMKGVHSWTFSAIENKLFKVNHPFVNVAPSFLTGPVYGAFNQRDLRISFGPVDDFERTALFIERDRKMVCFERVCFSNRREEKEGGSVSLRQTNAVYDYKTQEYKKMIEKFFARYGRIFILREKKIKNEKERERFPIVMKTRKELLEEFPTDTFVVKENFGSPTIKTKKIMTRKLF